VAEIRGSGLVGEAFIHLDVSAAEGAALSPGSRLQGRSDESMKTLMAKIRVAAEKLGGAGGAIRDADFGSKLDLLGTDVARIADDLGRVSRSADSLLMAGRHVVIGMEPGMLRSLESLDRSMARLALTMGRTDTLVAATSQDVRSSVRALRQLVERLDGVLGRIDTLVQLKEQEIDETLTNLHATSESVRDLTENPWKLVVGRGDGQVAEEMEAATQEPEE
jgi:ABC-type transporter Mla subunit MlaD